MAELADAPDLGSGGPPCRFKSCRPHHKKTVPQAVLFFYICCGKRGFASVFRRSALAPRSGWKRQEKDMDVFFAGSLTQTPACGEPNGEGRSVGVKQVTACAFQLVVSL